MYNSLGKGLFTAAVILFFLALPCLAAGPDAGQLLREQKSKPQLPRQLPEPETPCDKKVKNAGVKISVKRFIFTGYQGLVSEAELQQVVAQDLNKEFTFCQLQAVAGKVTEYLRDRGWMLARAYLPRQDVTSGTVTIAVVQGKSNGELNIEDDGNLRIRQERLRRMAQKGITRDRPINSRDLERAVLLMNDLPGITAKASLSPGTDPDTTLLTIKAGEGPLFSGILWADNHGNRYTGTERANAMLNINGPFRIGDRANIVSAVSEDMQTGELNYAIPLAANGLRGEISYTYLQYGLGKEFESLDADGDAHTVNAGITYPLVRSRRTNIYTSLQYEYKALTDAVRDIETGSKILNSAIFTANGDHYDNFYGGGLTTWRIAVTCGAMDEDAYDAGITGIEGGFTYFNAGFSRLQRLARNLTLSLSWQAQYSLDNLASSEQFSLGGPYGVRAYPVSEGQGDHGHLFNIQADYTLPIPDRWGKFMWGLFYDAGHITLHNSPWTNAITTATGDNRYWLQGAGTRIEYSYNERFSLSGTWAHTIGSNDGRDTNGNDSSGKQDNSRVWVQAVLRF